MAKKRSGSRAHVKRSAPTDWQTVEHVVAAVEKVRSRTAGLVVTRKAQLPRLTDPSDTRDIDVLVEVPIGDRVLRIAIEVKGRGRPLSMDLMGSLVDLCNDVAVDRFCVVSASGFTKGARRKAAENNIELETLQEFETSDTWIMPPGAHRLRSSGHIFHATFYFSDEVTAKYGPELAAAIAGVPHDDIFLMAGDITYTATQVMSDALNKHLSRHREYIDKSTVLRVGTSLRDVANLQMRIGERVYPGPVRIVAEANYEQKVEPLPERRFRLGNTELSTMRIDNDEVSILTTRRPDGTTQVAAVKGPVAPPSVRR